jgi:uncharacterized protein (DUF983 family)
MTTMPFHVQTASQAPSLQGQRSVAQAVLRGAQLACPACGLRTLFRSYLKVADHCPHCGEALHHHRADDAPPYFTMLIIGHVVVAGVLMVEQIFHPAQWLHFILWVPLTIALSLWLLPHVKGGLIGLQWACRMHGFGAGPDPADPLPAPTASSALKSRLQA